MIRYRIFRLFTLAAAAQVWTAAVCAASLNVLVMDPLAKQLSCACVQGTAQRDYDQLGQFLAKQLRQPVRVVYAEDMEKALRSEPGFKLDLIIGKDSVVRFDAQASGLKVTPLCRMTGKDGTTTLKGLFVVKTDDPAKTLADVAGRKILFGQPEADEKHAAALGALKAAGVAAPSQLATKPICNEAAMEVAESKLTPPPVGVISSYALVLLEGCGNISKGALRVLAETAPVPFVTVFTTDHMPGELKGKIYQALLAAGKSKKMLQALESKHGFTTVDSAGTSTTDWPGWRGTQRDGHAAWLPERLPAQPKVAWRQGLNHTALAGVVVGNGFVITADRDLMDQKDAWICLRADNGDLVWRLEYPATGEQLDYGNSPRATPLIHQGMVYLLGAYGDLRCVDLATGKVVWSKKLSIEFNVKVPKWGMASSPLIRAGLLLVNPGAKNASLAALDPLTGKTKWKTYGRASAYASFISAELGGRDQLVGYDQVSLGGWDPSTGKRLWSLLPPKDGDFNVPTPLAIGGRLLVATENNGTRLFGFNELGAINSKPLAMNEALAPDTASLVQVQGRIFGCHEGLHCLTMGSDGQSLTTLWVAKEEAFSSHANLIASTDRLLAITYTGELILLDPLAAQYSPVSRLKVFAQPAEIFAHPAMAGTRLYLRAADALLSLDLGN